MFKTYYIQLAYIECKEGTCYFRNNHTNRTNGWQFFYQLTSQIITWTKHPCISLKVFCCPSRRVLGLQNTHCWNVIIHFSWTCQSSNIQNTCGNWENLISTCTVDCNWKFKNRPIKAFCQPCCKGTGHWSNS